MAVFIAICDDEKSVSAELECALLDILGKQNIKYEIDVYHTGEELCTQIESGTHYDVIFLDIEFAKNAINGVEVGRLIREAYRKDLTSIVYISWEMKYSMQLFDIRPLNFLIKPLDMDKVRSVVKTFLSMSSGWSQFFSYKVGHSTYKVPIKDIVYLENEKRKVIIHLANGSIEEFYGTLNQVYQEQLQGLDFLFIHTSYMVNFDYIKAVKYREVVLTTGNLPLPISRAKRSEIREVYCAIADKRRI